MFDAVKVTETLADDPAKLHGRIAECTVQDLTADFSKAHIKLYFQINDVKGLDAYTKFVGHDLTSDYIRRQTRRKRSKMDGVYDVRTKDGYLLRVKPMAIAEKRIQNSQQSSIRRIMGQTLASTAKDKLLSEFVRNIISGDMASTLFKACKPIYPIKRIEIRQSEILEEPEPVAVGETPPEGEVEVEKRTEPERMEKPTDVEDVEPAEREEVEEEKPADEMTASKTGDTDE
jgi:small subunit ribosomal protein S3Ae